MGGLFSAPKVPTTPNPPTAAVAPVGSSRSSNSNTGAAALQEQRAAALQGGTVMAGTQGGQTTKTLLGQ